MSRRRRSPKDRKSVEVTGRSIDDAVAKATSILKASEHDLEIEVLDEGRGGFLGIGSKEARVRAILKRSDARGRGGDGEARGRDGEGRDGDRDGRRRRRRDGEDRGRGGESRDRGGESRDRSPRAEQEDSGSDAERGPRGDRGGRGRDRDRDDRPRGGRSGAGDRDGSRRRRRRDEGGDRPRRERRPDREPATIMTEPDPEFEKQASELLSGILDRMGFSPEVDAKFEEGAYLLTIEGGDDDGILIGRKGETLDALQHLVYKSVTQGRENYATIKIDVSGYRERRESALVDQAREMAEEVLRSGKSQQTEPLRPSERRVIHRALTEMEGVSSRALGSGVVKRVLLEPEGAEGQDVEEPAATGGRSDDSGRAPRSRPAPAPRPTRAPEPAASGEVLDLIGSAEAAETKPTKKSEKASDWGRRSRPSKKVRRR